MHGAERGAGGEGVGDEATAGPLRRGDATLFGRAWSPLGCRVLVEHSVALSSYWSPPSPAPLRPLPARGGLYVPALLLPRLLARGAVTSPVAHFHGDRGTFAPLFHPELSDCQDLSLIPHAGLYLGDAVRSVLSLQRSKRTRGCGPLPTLPQALRVSCLEGTSCLAAREPHAALHLNTAFQGTTPAIPRAFSTGNLGTFLPLRPQGLHHLCSVTIAKEWVSCAPRVTLCSSCPLSQVDSGVGTWSCCLWVLCSVAWGGQGGLQRSLSW